MPDCAYVEKPGRDASSRYGPTGKFANTYAPVSAVTTERVAVVSVFVTFTSTPGSTAPVVSRTVPDIWEATVCPSTIGQKANIVANVASALFIQTSTTCGFELVFNSAIGKRLAHRKSAGRLLLPYRRMLRSRRTAY